LTTPLRKWSHFTKRLLPRYIAKYRSRGHWNNFDYIFIIAYGRSGSTLLQLVLNSIDGVLIRGENQNFFEKLYRADKALRVAMSHRGSQPQHPWYGAECIELNAFRAELKRSVVDYVLRPQPGDVVVGFKEIRYTVDLLNDEDFEEYLDFLRETFSRAAFIFNTRDLIDVNKSGWWADRPDSMKILSATEKRFQKYLQRQLPDCIHIHYNNYFEDAAALMPLFDFLGARFDRASVERLLSTRLSH